MDSSSLLDFRPKVTVDADAPFGKLVTGRGIFNFRSPQGTSYSPKGTLNVNVPVPVMCLVAPKDAKLHDPVRIWKRSDIDKAEYASDWRYANNRLESTDGTCRRRQVRLQLAHSEGPGPDVALPERQPAVWTGPVRAPSSCTNTGKCMDAGGGRRNGDIVTLQPSATGDPNQQFTWSGSTLVVR
ncbi:hypothetical protein ACFWN5_34835 [Streptomyces sp. NPDC058430]|uniref:hypothetical protein n=1 Tax=Streptomyces sp. NPDC058430 TaxID=3346495 RepID=UPI003661F8C5